MAAASRSFVNGRVALSGNSRPGRVFNQRVLPRLSAQRGHVVCMVQQAKVGEIVVNSSPSEDELKSMGVRSWPTWGCDASNFPWTYDANETCFILEGTVTVTPDDGEAVDIKPGDLVTFPKGMSCTWDVQKAINKHYKFH